MHFTQGHTKPFVLPSNSYARRESQQPINTHKTPLCNDHMELLLQGKQGPWTCSQQGSREGAKWVRRGVPHLQRINIWESLKRGSEPPQLQVDMQDNYCVAFWPASHWASDDMCTSLTPPPPPENPRRKPPEICHLQKKSLLLKSRTPLITQESRSIAGQLEYEWLSTWSISHHRGPKIDPPAWSSAALLLGGRVKAAGRTLDENRSFFAPQGHTTIQSVPIHTTILPSMQNKSFPGLAVPPP